ncbi:MAG: hypothetical protein AUK03_17085 [Anaerolineae bacterium CG2_30_64_16]|nr:MAG: hypothetical protein AUK03_17085 [Anaerolineae bacterium CG2_30_64_16]
MIVAQLLGAFLALASAAVFGGGDFSGGVATRRHHQFQVLALSAIASIALLAAFALLWRETLPSPRSVLWAAAAGVAGSLGLAALYRGLSLGNAASVSPTAGVIGAAVPVVFAALTEGLPPPVRMMGFAIAIAGIWLVTRVPAADGLGSRHNLLLAVFAGIAFGAFFIFIAQVEADAVFLPLMFAKIVAFGLALALLRLKRLPLPGPRSNPIALLAGLLDASANALYLVASQLTRLDVAVVLTSLYPAGTVLLARGLQKEPTSRPQWVGVLLCLVAIALIVV